MERMALNSDYLFRLELDVAAPQVIGAGPIGDRRIGVITGGRFLGPGLAGKVLPGGADWLLTASDGGTRLDVRLVLQAADGQVIGLTYQGIRHAPPEIAARIAAGEEVEPGSYYMRVAMRFETGPGPHEWLNRVLAVAVGHRFPKGPVYDVYAVL
ncbi:DUF3237 domain-containing protein [Roseomonas sp. BU-1]|uniref:UPF0311 protein HEQ75_07070 n=2 Tax=Falsiroseomonas selenitidurans TaxID=2716335 RepID=A0ABX1E0J5_9PROT|nr:DUF3237 domain-containing protein [Falsiroseomonas selenitidurans]